MVQDTYCHERAFLLVMGDAPPSAPFVFVETLQDAMSVEVVPPEHLSALHGHPDHCIQDGDLLVGVASLQNNILVDRL